MSDYTTQYYNGRIKKARNSTFSQMQFIRVGMNETGFSHILSFRRQIYVQPEDIEKIPPSMQITYDSTAYWIYLSTEKLTCFICKEEGHVAGTAKTLNLHKLRM